jgi:prepilin-type N-terminal cleavage/methylation domain-containing protein
MIYSRKNKKTGFSLLELILAVAIFSLGGVAMATLMIDSNISTKLSAERTEALFYAKEGLEAVRSIHSNAWADLAPGSHGLNYDNGVWAFSDSSDLINDKYTRVVEVEEVSSSTKNVSLSITWNLTTARVAEVILHTVFTNWLNN